MTLSHKFGDFSGAEVKKQRICAVFLCLEHYIKEETVAVVIDKWERTAQLLEQLSNGNKRVRRELQQYSVALRVYGEFDQALKQGLIRDTGCGVYVLSNPDNYDPETGLDLGIQPIYMA